MSDTHYLSEAIPSPRWKWVLGGTRGIRGTLTAGTRTYRLQVKGYDKLQEVVLALGTSEDRTSCTAVTTYRVTG